MRKNGGFPKTRVEQISVDQIPPGALADFAVLSRKPVAKKRPHAGHQPAKIKVLVVDDYEVIAQTLAEILGRQGYECFAVYSGESAIAAAESFSPNVILMDVMMPRMNGIDASVRIQKSLPDCRILLFSNQIPVAHALMEETRKAGQSFELLSKPLEPRALVAKIEALFAGAHSQAGLQRAELRA